MQTESSCSDAVCSSFFFLKNGGKYKQTNFSSLKFNMEHGVTAWFTLLPLHTCMRENVLWWKMEELWLLLVYDSGYQCCMLSATVTSPPTPKGLNLSLWALLTSKMSESCQGELMAHARSFLSNYIVRHIICCWHSLCLCLSETRDRQPRDFNLPVRASLNMWQSWNKWIRLQSHSQWPSATC